MRKAGTTRYPVMGLGLRDGLGSNLSSSSLQNEAAIALSHEVNSSNQQLACDRELWSKMCEERPQWLRAYAQ